MSADRTKKMRKMRMSQAGADPRRASASNAVATLEKLQA
jgi:hypothetical protein